MVTFSSQYNAVGKTGALARIKALSLSCIRRHCVSIKKKSKSLKEGPWWKTGLFFLKFCHKIGITHKTLLQHTHFCSRITVSRKKYNICVFVWVVNCTSHFFHGTSFLLERMTERQIMVFGSVWQMVSQKWAKWVYGLKEKNTVFPADDKIWTFKWKKRISENLCPPLWAWQFPNI